MSVINIKEKLKLFSKYWSPKKKESLFGMVTKMKMSFLVLEGQFYMVPKGVMHKPIVREVVHVLLLKSLDIKHTGAILSNTTVETFETI